MSDIGAQLLAELRGVSLEDYKVERSLRRRRSGALARRYNYRPLADVRWRLDWEGRPVLVRRDFKPSNDYEAVEAVLFTVTVEALMEETDCSWSKVIRALEGFVPTPAGHSTRKYTQRPFAVRNHRDGNVW